ncbi:MAG: pseudaminic acid synthase [Butyrivibrio sp.]|nr:pseudaminic acid synthase [Butyrivibrio sp.]
MKLYDKINAGQTYMIAEMSANHAGDLNRAMELIETAAAAGADCVKTQTYTADTLTIDSDAEAFKIHGGLWDGYVLHDLYKEAYTPWEWMEPIKKKCEECGVDFLSTPYDTTSVDYLENIGAEFFKIASFELTDVPLLRYVARLHKPIIMSTGMASEEEIQDAIDAIKSQGNDQIILLKCCNAYPTVTSDLNLRTIPDMKKKFGVPVGLSDHSLGHTAAVGAVALGAQVIEKHFCMSRKIKNPDSAFSMEPQEYKAMVEGVRDIERAMGKVFYGPTEAEHDEYNNRRSLFVVEDIKAGEKLTETNIRSIRSFNARGILPKYYDEMLGKTAINDISRGTPLTFELVK